jgi:hypothetical protein
MFAGTGTGGFFFDFLVAIAGPPRMNLSICVLPHRPRRYVSGVPWDYGIWAGTGCSITINGSGWIFPVAISISLEIHSDERCEERESYR